MANSEWLPMNNYNTPLYIVCLKRMPQELEQCNAVCCCSPLIRSPWLRGEQRFQFPLDLIVFFSLPPPLPALTLRPDSVLPQVSVGEKAGR